jgi:tRNA pseudouridine55 synthase
MALFRGELLQAPPVYSAVHIGGERAHKLARAGRPVEMPKRPVTVYALELRSYDPPLASVAVHCSSGTYIRSLARDIALAAGSRGHLSALSRTRIAGFKLEDALEIPASDGADAAVLGALRPIDEGVFEALGLPRVSVDQKTAARMVRGQPLDTLPEALPAGLGEAESAGPGETGAAGPSVAGVFCDGGLVGVIEKRPRPGGTGWVYGYVYARP